MDFRIFKMKNAHNKRAQQKKWRMKRPRNLFIEIPLNHDREKRRAVATMRKNILIPISNEIKMERTCM